MRKVTLELQPVIEPSIVLGYNIGSAQLDDGTKLEVLASGSLIRFQFTGFSVDMEINRAAHMAYDMYKDDLINTKL